MTKRPKVRLLRSFVIATGLAFLFLPEPAFTAPDSISTDDFVSSEAGQAFQQGDYDRALAEIDPLVKQHGDDPLLIRYRAIALDRLGRSEEAIETFKKLLKADPDHIPTHYFLGQAYYHNGLKDMAREEWKWVLIHGEGTAYEPWAQSALELSQELKIPPLPKKGQQRGYFILRYGYEYDSNVTLRPNDETLASPADHNAGRQVIDLQTRLGVHSRRDLAVDFVYAVSQTIHDDSLEEFNFHNQEFGLDLRKRVKIRNQDVVAGLRYGVHLGFLEADLFAIRNRWQLSADTRFTHQTRTVVYDRATYAEYGPDGSDPARASRDGFYNDAGVTHYFYSNDLKSHVYLQEEFESAFTRGRNFDRVGIASRIGAHRPLVERLDLDLSGGVQLRFYPNFSSLSTRDSSRRRTINWDIYAALTYHLTPKLGLRGFYRYIDVANQNNFFDYRRHIGGVQLIYRQSF